MKKLLLAVILLFTVSFIAVSCMSTGKMGCPTNVGSGKPFRS
ncbi:hypothetical protein PDL71_11680 [Lacibacter sp. MH-610]